MHPWDTHTSAHTHTHTFSDGTDEMLHVSPRMLHGTRSTTDGEVTRESDMAQFTIQYRGVNVLNPQYLVI